MTYLKMVLIIFLALWSNGYALAFSSGSTGLDGALDFSSSPSGSIIDFDPASFTPALDTDEDGIYHFTTITVPTDVTLRFSPHKAGFAPIHWLASGTVVIDGILDLSGQDGHAASVTGQRFPALAGPGGFPGGVGGNLAFLPQSGFGPGAGRSTIGHGGGAGHAIQGTGPPASSGPTYGNGFLLPLLGGSGGAGGNKHSTGPGAGGGAGGGAILIASSVSIRINGEILVKGGAGGQPIALSGGNGSGGAIRLLAPLVTGSGKLDASSGVNSPWGLGWIRIESFGNTFVGEAKGDIRAVTIVPNPIIISALPLRGIRIVSIGGVAVPANPRARLDVVDVTLAATTDVQIVLEGRNIPAGTPITVNVMNETNGSTIITSTPLSGTGTTLSATATVTIPSGFSQIFTRATW